MTSASHPVNFVRLLLLSLSVALAALVGTLPVGSFLQNRLLPFLLAAEAIVFVGGYLYSHRDQKPVTEGAGGLEYLLRALSAISLWGFVGLLTLFVYKGLELFLRLVGSSLNWLGLSIAFNATTIAFYLTFAFALVCGLGVAAAIGQSIATRIYSVSVSSRNVDYSKTLGAQNRIYLYIALTLLALNVMVVLDFFVTGKGFWFHVVLQLIPYLASAWLLDLGTRVYTDSEIVKGIARMFRAQGFDVVISPRATDPKLQGMLTGIDMLATKPNEAYVIQVKTASSSTADVDWTVGSGLQTKAVVLGVPEIAEELGLASLSGKKILPLLIICGRKKDQTLEEFSSRYHLDVVTLDAEAVNRLPVLLTTKELLEFAEKHFSQTSTASAVSSSELGEGVMHKGETWA